jgi:hypothetical protein
MVGVGVGFAAMLGTMRFVKGWPMLPLIWATLIPAVLAAMYMWCAAAPAAPATATACVRWLGPAERWERDRGRRKGAEGLLPSAKGRGMERNERGL